MTELPKSAVKLPLPNKNFVEALWYVVNVREIRLWSDLKSFDSNFWFCTLLNNGVRLGVWQRNVIERMIPDNKCILYSTLSQFKFNLVVGTHIHVCAGRWHSDGCVWQLQHTNAISRTSTRVRFIKKWYSLHFTLVMLRGHNSMKYGIEINY